jgi:hypothetical protein
MRTAAAAATVDWSKAHLQSVRLAGVGTAVEQYNAILSLHYSDQESK